MPSGYEISIKSDHKNQLKYDSENNKILILMKGNTTETEFYSSE